MNYIEAISIGFPGVECHTFGDPFIYEDIIWDGGLSMPSKETLDAWLASNTITNVRRITPYALRQRFTVNEKIAVELAAIDVHTASAEQRQFSALIRVTLGDLQSAAFVDLNNPDVIGIIQLFESNGLIGTGRASEILNATIQENELPL